MKTLEWCWIKHIIHKRTKIETIKLTIYAVIVFHCYDQWYVFSNETERFTLYVDDKFVPRMHADEKRTTENVR